MSESKRQKLDVPEDACVICLNGFTETRKASIAKVNKLDKLFESASIRKDETTRRLQDNENEIRSGHIRLKYHRHCRITYTSNDHLGRVTKAKEQVENESTEEEQPSSSTRSKTEQFDWKLNCFICGKYCSPNHKEEWSMIQTSTGSKGAKSTYERVLAAAKERKDTTVINRLLGVANADLVAVEARYHTSKGCQTLYINERNIKADLKKRKENIYREVLKKTMEEYLPLMNNEEQVFLLSSIRKRFCALLSNEGVDSSTYRSQSLKTNIQKLGMNLTFYPQPGKSDLVCASHLPISSLLRQIEEIDNECLSDEDCEDEDLFQTGDSDDVILHKAASILREEMSKTQSLQEEYYSVNEIDLENQAKFVGKQLFCFIGWLIDKQSFQNASLVEKDKLRVVTISSDIIYAATGIPSPKHLGLAVYLHHDFGSKKLNEISHTLGYSVSYKEESRFNTSVAIHVTENQQTTESGALVPHQVKTKEEGGALPVTSGDNWDHNERTVDGKGNTHAMTSILVTPQTPEDSNNLPEYPRIKRYSSATLSGADLSKVSLTYRKDYRKPGERPEPRFPSSVNKEDVGADYTNAAVLEKRGQELSYHLSNINGNSSEKTVPNWKHFNIQLHSEGQPLSVVSFNPILMATPTDPSTIYTLLLRAKETNAVLGFEHAPVFFDMGLLGKALEIVWSRPEELLGVIPLPGGMHLLMCLIASIGNLYGDAGLKQLLHESGVFASGTINNMLAGKDFDRALYALYLIDEVLHIRLLKSFKLWCNQNGKSIPKYVWKQLDSLSSASQNKSKLNKAMEKVMPQVTKKVFPLLESFRKEGCEKSETFKLWDEFLQRVLIPFKLFMIATRSADWELYKESQKQILPILFAANRITYCRYLPVCIALMEKLPDEVESAFRKGQFVSKLTEGSFNSVWNDYCLETTENKDLKGGGGIIGITRKGEALLKWFLSRHINSTYSRAFLLR